MKTIMDYKSKAGDTPIFHICSICSAVLTAVHPDNVPLSYRSRASRLAVQDINPQSAEHPGLR